VAKSCQAQGIVFLDGELYIHGTTFQDITTRVRYAARKSMSLDPKRAAELEYWIYDCVPDDAHKDASCSDRQAMIRKGLGSAAPTCLRMVRGIHVRTEDLHA